MHLFKKQLVFSVVIAFAVMQSAYADLAVVGDSSQAAALPISLKQATSIESPATTLDQVTKHAKPSTVALGVIQDQGIRFVITTPFTPEEINKYPGCEKAFAEHAAGHLESENSSDVAAIVYLAHAYPEIAGYLAIQAPNRRAIHKDIKNALATSKRPPIMTSKKAAEVAAIISVNNAGLHLALGFSKALLLGANEFNYHAKNFMIPDIKDWSNGSGTRKVYYELAQKTFEHAAHKNAAEGWNKFKNAGWQPIGTFPHQVISGLPKAITVGIGTTALSTIILREFDERVGDPIPCPKYDPESKNVAYYSCVLAKWAVRNVAIPMAISNFVVAPAIDKTTSTIKDLATQPIDVLSQMDINNW